MGMNEIENKTFVHFIKNAYFCNPIGGLAQLARAFAWHARGHRFDSDILHPITKKASEWKPFLLDIGNVQPLIRAIKLPQERIRVFSWRIERFFNGTLTHPTK